MVGPVAGQWSYANAVGEEIFRVVRFQTAAGKVFRMIHRTPAGWLQDGPPGLLPLFHLPLLAGASRVFLCEGEKVAEAVCSLPGLLATTSAHGAESPFRSDWAPLAGKEVIILPDHDEAGASYTRLVLEQLAALTPRPVVRIVPLEMIWKTSVPISDGRDVVDWLQCGLAPAWTPTKCCRELLSAAAATSPIDFDALAADGTHVDSSADSRAEGGNPGESTIVSSSTNLLTTNNGQLATEQGKPDTAPSASDALPMANDALEGRATSEPDVASVDADGEAGGDGSEADSAKTDAKSRGRTGRARDEERGSAAEMLMRIAARARYFPGDDDRFYAQFDVGDREETHELRSQSFRRWLIREYRKDTKGFVPVEALNSLIASLEADAEAVGPARNVYLRVGGDLEGSVIYLDLGDPTRRAVAITADGWEIVARPGVTFRRPKGMRPLPEPRPGGSLDLLKKYVNTNDDEFLLLIGWLAAALRPTGPYPIMVLNSEQGSAKSTLARIVRKLVDPHVSPLAGDPREARDLMVAAQNCWALALDNISTLPPWLSDSLCRLATGGGLHVRTLYSNDESSFLDATRPIILSGIDEFVRRGDLSDRSVYLHPPTILDDDRRLQGKLMAEFDREHPLILGALLDAVAGGLRMEPLIDLPRLPRMADFAHFAEAVCQGLGHPPGTFLAAYNQNRQAANESVLEDSPVARIVRTFMVDTTSWTGTASELLDELSAMATERALASRAWPRTPKALASVLRRIAPQLRTTGLIVDFDRSKNTRNITITRQYSAADHASLASPTSTQSVDSDRGDAG